MPRYVPVFDAHAMDSIADQDKPDVDKGGARGQPGGHRRRTSSRPPTTSPVKTAQVTSVGVLGLVMCDGERGPRQDYARPFFIEARPLWALRCLLGQTIRTNGHRASLQRPSRDAGGLLATC